MRVSSLFKRDKTVLLLSLKRSSRNDTKTSCMVRYDHRSHAGNAGDVWKHFLLAEAADCLLQNSPRLFYAESHCGRPYYLLTDPGEWEGGIGRIRHLLPSLKDFSYSRILSDLNPSSAPGTPGLLYPGSARLIYELAFRKSAELQAEIWDLDPQVADSWRDFLFQEASGMIRSHPEICFHPSDGFSGVLSHLSRLSCQSSPGLLFIDPPYVEAQDAPLAERLLQKALDRGWIVLWWYMTDMMTAPAEMDSLELEFAPVGLDGGRWKGAGVALAGPNGQTLDRIRQWLRRMSRQFIRILKSD